MKNKKYFICNKAKITPKLYKHLKRFLNQKDFYLFLVNRCNRGYNMLNFLDFDRSAIIGSFKWGDTEEGSDYWVRICNKWERYFDSITSKKRVK